MELMNCGVVVDLGQVELNLVLLRGYDEDLVVF